MAKEFKTLTGRWLGRYEYSYAAEPVGFEADLIDDAGALTGDIREANSFQPGQGAELFATLVGTFAEGEVSFTKTYLGFAHPDNPRYTGQANAALTRIEGTWHFPALAGPGGRFVMMRKPQASATAERSIATELTFTR